MTLIASIVTEWSFALVFVASHALGMNSFLGSGDKHVHRLAVASVT